MIKKEINIASDPLITAFINDYTKEEEEYFRGGMRDDDLLVNFDITYNKNRSILKEDSINDEKVAQNEINTNEYENFYKEMNGENDKATYLKEQKKRKDLGIIKVKSFLEVIDGEPLKGVKVNLYITNGVSPKLIKSGVTDDDGVVIFSDIECGNYRIIQIIDKVYFEKPIYKKWNEVNITADNNFEEVFVINRVKSSFRRSN